jgi:hypothetical protein
LILLISKASADLKCGAGGGDGCDAGDGDGRAMKRHWTTAIGHCWPSKREPVARWECFAHQKQKATVQQPAGKDKRYVSQ